MDVRGASECWPWTRTTEKGYGRYGRKHIPAHRLAYTLLVGPIPEGLTLDHLCRNRACCNPAHLEPVSVRENVLRGAGPSAQNARRTSCVNGHEFTSENTIVRRDGRRNCRHCQRDRDKLFKRRIRSSDIDTVE